MLGHIDEIELVRSALARLEAAEDSRAVPGLITALGDATTQLISAVVAMAFEEGVHSVPPRPRFRSEPVDLCDAGLVDPLMAAPLTWGLLAQPCRDHWGRAAAHAIALAEDTEPGAFELASSATLRLRLGVELDLYTQAAPPLSDSGVLWLWVGARVGTDAEPTCLLHGPIDPRGLEHYRQVAPGSDIWRLVRLAPGDVVLRAEVEPERVG